nr:unnamed protein product [Callosobruchus analis]
MEDIGGKDCLIGFVGGVARSIQLRRSPPDPRKRVLRSARRCFTPSRRTGFRPFPPRENHQGGGGTETKRPNSQFVPALSQLPTYLNVRRDNQFKDS